MDISKILAIGFALIAFAYHPGEVEAQPPDGYHLVWADEFDGSGRPDLRNWTYELGFVRNKELQWYQAENAFREEGVLVIEGRRERKPHTQYQPQSGGWRAAMQFIEYTSSSLTTRELHSWQYGYFEIRARLRAEEELWPAIWFLGVEGEWPSSGEIDLMEYYQGHILANACWGTRERWVGEWNTSKRPLDSFGDPEWAEKFHVWSMTWDEQRIELAVDGEVLSTIEISDIANPTDRGPKNPFRQPHYLLINLAIGGNAGGNPTHTAFPTRYEIDYARVYQRGGHLEQSE